MNASHAHRLIISLALGAALVGGVSTVRAQQENLPPRIVQTTVEIARTTSGDPLGPYLAAVPFDPLTELAFEHDIVIYTLTVDDPDLAPMGMDQGDAEDIFMNVQAYWIQYPGYPVPEPPPVPETLREFFEPALLPGMAATQRVINFALTVPAFSGPSQARLRGLIAYDVQWLVQFALSNSQTPGCAEDLIGGVRPPCDEPVSFGLTPLFAIKSPLRPPPNPQAFADAGADQTAPVGQTVILDGSRTFDTFNLGFNPVDPNVFARDNVSYVWEWISGPERVEPIVRNPATTPWLAEVTLNQIGIYVYRLTADDNFNSLPTQDSVTITVVSGIPENRPPVARIIGPAVAIEGGLITLDGTTSSDPDGDRLTFLWRQTDELGNNLSPADTARLFQPISGLQSPISSWQAVKTGTFYFRLLVDDGQLQSSARVEVTVMSAITLGTVVVAPTGSAPAANDSAAEVSPTAAPAPLLCGAGLLPLALTPLLLWPLRGRIR
ncbi:MAG: hypothetical protein AB7Q17_02795 [Phycisphaerae bacterium]